MGWALVLPLSCRDQTLEAKYMPEVSKTKIKPLQWIVGVFLSKLCYLHRKWIMSLHAGPH